MYKNSPFLVFFFLLLPFFAWSQAQKKQPYEPGVVVFKLKPTASAMPNERQASPQAKIDVAEKIKQKAGARQLTQPFARAKNAKNTTYVQRQGSSVLDGIYKMELPEGLSVEEVVAMLKQMPDVQYAEPYYIPELLEVPNDPQYESQQHLSLIKATEAWAIQKGSRNIIIGILDTGVDLTHPDLQGNLHTNENDPIDGIDNDGDGFIDNYRGWDFANNDNNPQADQNPHGTLVAGLAAATTNNAVGVAGVGFNTRYMPIKVFSSKDGRFIRGYEAIAYAADMGCQVINLSWGAPGGRSDFVQDIIDYAVLEKNAVVVAAAGNLNQELDYYPASYNNVLSVSSTDYSDKKAGHCWSRFVDVMAPGASVLGPTNGDRYVRGTGTSYASPQVAAAAALIRAHYPALTAQQVMERLRRSTDNISSIGNNASYQYRIGTGRLNIQKALEPTIGPSIRMDQYVYTNGFGKYAFHKDTIELWIDVTNYLEAAGATTVKLVSESEYVTLLKDEISLPALGTLGTATTKATPFRFVLSSTLPALKMLSFRLEFSSGNYRDYQYFELRTSGEYVDVTANELTLTVASNGNLGYNYDYNLQGLGLRYQNAPLAHNMGLLIGQTATATANNMIFYNSPAIRDQDFKIQDRLRLYANSGADVDARSSFRTIYQDSVKLNLQIDQKILGWNDPNSASVVLEYRVINRADTTYNNLHVALFSDFNLNQFFLNRASWDAEYQLGYTYDDSKGIYAGVALLSGQELLYHALDLNTREGNTAEVGEVISRREKFNFINQGVAKTTAGQSGKGNDVAQVVGGTIKELLPYSAQKVVFTFVTATSLEELKAITLKAKQNYNLYRSAPPLIAQVTACAGMRVEITPRAGTRYRFYADLDATEFLGEAETLLLHPFTESKTLYVASMENGFAGELQRVEVTYAQPAAAFSMSTDLLKLNAQEEESVQFFGESADAVSWQWNFGNGFQSSLKEPVMYYTKPGTYTIRLSTTTAAGCVATVQKTLRVIQLEDAPEAADQTICAGEKALIQDAQGRPIHVYADEARTQLLFRGPVFESEVLRAPTVFYLTSGEGETESLSTQVSIYVPQNLAQFELPAGPLPFDPSALFRFSSSSSEAVRWLWNFGDGSSSDLQSPIHIYAEPGSYTVSLTAYSAGGCEETSEQVLTLQAPQGLFTQKEVLKLQAYPNPTNGKATLRLPTTLLGSASLQILDVRGALLSQQLVQGIGEMEIDLEQLPTGIYLIRLQSGDQLWQSRIIRR